MSDLEIKKVCSQDELNKVFDIRKKVFILEQNVPADLEMDNFDSASTHFIVLYKSKPIGCARIRTNDKAKLERIAILKEYRNKGYGTDLVNFLIDYCKQQNINDIYLHSQYFTIAFYKKFGFESVGKEFFEAGIRHIKMIYKN